MKKFFVLLFCLILPFNLISCKTTTPLTQYVSELRSELYLGKTDAYSVKACYGFREQPYLNDGKVGEKFYKLTFMLLDKQTENSTFSISFSYNGENYTADFKPSHITGTLTCEFYIDNFTEKQFNVNISWASNQQTVTLNSVLPDKAISYDKALEYLNTNQPDLVKSLTDTEGNLTCEIYARIIVKNDKPYWYIGLACGNNQLKALLIDGICGEILAIREVI